MVCIPWTGPTEHGYPVEDGKRALRALLEARLGRPVVGMVLHTCRNKLCANVEHLRESVVRSPRLTEAWREKEERKQAHQVAMDAYRRRKAREKYARNKAKTPIQRAAEKAVGKAERKKARAAKRKKDAKKLARALAKAQLNAPPPTPNTSQDTPDAPSPS